MNNKKIFTVLFISAMATSVGIGIIIPILPLYAKSMGANGTLIGLVFSSFAISKTIVNPFIGRMSDRIGKKPCILSGLMLFTLVAVFFTLARNTYDLIGIRLFMGIANAMVVPIVGAYVGELAKQDNEASYMAVFNISVLAGFGIGPLAGGILSERFGTNAAFWAMAIATIFALMAVILFLPSKDPHIDSQPISNPLGRLFAIPRLRGLILLNFINTIGVGGIMVFLPILTQKNHITKTEIGILISIIFSLTGILQLPMGRLIDRSSNKRAFILTGATFSIIALIMLPLAINFWGYLMIGIFSACGGAISAPASYAIIIRDCREIGLGFSVAMFDSVQAAGFIIGPLLSGIIMDILGIDAVFFFTAAVYLIGIWFFNHFSRQNNPLQSSD